MPNEFPSIMPFWCSSSRREKALLGGGVCGLGQVCVVLAASLILWSLADFFGCEIYFGVLRWFDLREIFDAVGYGVFFSSRMAVDEC